VHEHSNMNVNTLYKDMLFSVLRLVTTDEHGGGGTGTGVLIDLELIPGTITPVLVTNKHVVQDAKEISLHLPAQAGPTGVVLGDTVQIRLELEEDRFFSPQDSSIDIAIMPFGAVLRALEGEPVGRFVRFLPVSEFPSDDEYASLDALEEVFFVGFPDGRWDDVNKTPIIRRGITATPAPLMFDGRQAFLIDASVFPGSSGSPVFVARTKTVLLDSEWKTQQLALFTGIVTESLQRAEHLSIFDMDHEINESLDLGVVTNLGAIKAALIEYCRYANQAGPKFRTSPLS
jgi:hypothetical protein